MNRQKIINVPLTIYTKEYYKSFNSNSKTALNLRKVQKPSNLINATPPNKAVLPRKINIRNGAFIWRSRVLQIMNIFGRYRGSTRTSSLLYSTAFFFHALLTKQVFSSELRFVAEASTALTSKAEFSFRVSCKLLYKILIVMAKVM